MRKILYIGFGALPLLGGAAVVYQDSLMEEVAKRGWKVSNLFTIPHYTISDKPYFKIWYKQNIKFIELCNSPIIPQSYIEPIKQCTQLQLENLVKEVLDEEKPDIVHIHELQMLPVSIIDAVSARGIASLKTMHNYYDICPQRDLMYGGSICENFEEGKRCLECLEEFPFGYVSFKRRFMRTVLSDFLYSNFSKSYMFIKNLLKHNFNINSKQGNCKINDSFAFLNRRKFFIERLNKLDIIHCSSHRLAQIFVNYGVQKDKIRIIPLSSKTLEMIKPKPLRDNHYPVVFGFVGGGYLHKGYHILIEAFSLLDQNKAKLLIWNMKKPKNFSQNLNVEFRRLYNPKQINQVLQEIDVGIVPSIWEEAFGLIGIEFLTARIPVIASNIGGIPEWLKDGENGFLVTPKDVQQLSKIMKLFIDDTSLITQMQRKINPWKSFSEHADEMITLYNDIIFQKR